jgi:hypothetical protein
MHTSVNEHHLFNVIAPNTCCLYSEAINTRFNESRGTFHNVCITGGLGYIGICRDVLQLHIFTFWPFDVVEVCQRLYCGMEPNIW